jgi:MYXO-CTERM domain-containing protein
VHRSIVLLLALAAFPSIVFAQTGGPDAFGYGYAPTTYDFVALTGDGSATPLSLTGDNEETVTLPFAFPFYGNTYTQAVISADGAISFNPGTNINYQNSCIPAAATDAPDIAPFWDDLAPTSGQILTLYDATEDRFIISWEDVAHAPNNNESYFQVHLYALGNIEFHYQDTFFSNGTSNYGTSATVGIQDNAGGTVSSGNYLPWFCNSPTLVDNTAFLFTSCPDADMDGAIDEACGGEDCDDADPATYPGAPEICDEIDQDCDGDIEDDEDDDDNDLETPCEGDCDDTNAAVLSTGTEVCDGLDNDCSGAVDEPFDSDSDGVATCVGDCNDHDATIYPGAPELCDGEDNDCDGQTYDTYESPTSGQRTTSSDRFRGSMFLANEPTFLDSIEVYLDPDGTVGNPTDLTFAIYEGSAQNGTFTLLTTNVQSVPSSGYGWYGSATLGITMQPGTYYVVGAYWNGTVGYGFNGSPGGFPFALDWGEHVGGADAGPVANLPTTYDTFASGTSYDTRIHTGGEGDFDQDLELTCEDCDDADASINSSAIEVCDGIDGNCDDMLMAGEEDLDDDTFLECIDDCDDEDSATYPGANELCDGIDNNCDGTVPTDEADADDDTYRICDGDCADTDPDLNPGRAEECNGVDDDCDGVLPPNEFDGDGDGYRGCDGDCDDSNADVNRGATEGGSTCNDGLDNDCDGFVDGADSDCGGTGDDDDDDDDDGDDDDDDDGGCDCESAFAPAPRVAGLWLLGVLAVVRRRR